MWDEQLSKYQDEEEALGQEEIGAAHRQASKAGEHSKRVLGTDLLKGPARDSFLRQHAVTIGASKRLFSEVYQMLQVPFCGLILTDATGRIIELFSSDELVSEGAKMGLLAGTSLSAASWGINAISLALDQRRPASVKGSQHFSALPHNWHCVAAPVFDVRGELVGAVNISTGYETGIGEKLALVTLMAEKLSAVFSSDPTLPSFSSRHRKILEMVSDGLTGKEIGAALDISARTVETHLERMRQRAGARTTAQLCALFSRALIARQPALQFPRYIEQQKLG